MILVISPLLGAAMVSGLAALAGGVGNYITNRQNNKSALDMQQNEQEFNQQQYEDWKYYNSIDQQVQRARAAGVSPLAVVKSDNLPQAFQKQNTYHEQSQNVLAGLSDAVGKSFATYYQGRDRQLRKEQLSQDLEIKQMQLDLNQARLNSLQEYQNTIMGLQNKRLSFDMQKWKDAFGFQKDQFQFKKDFYLSPEYSGYWDVQSKKQAFDFNATMNPIRISTARSAATIERERAARMADIINADLTLKAANAQLASNRAAISNETFQTDLDNAMWSAGRYKTQTTINDLQQQIGETLSWLNPISSTFRAFKPSKTYRVTGTHRNGNSTFYDYGVFNN